MAKKFPITKNFLKKLIHEKIVDTKKYRYVYTCDNTGAYVTRIEKSQLDTTGAITEWETKKIK